MNIPTIVVIVCCSCCIYVAKVSALTTDEFFEICESIPGECSQHPALQAYIGGALDLLATLDEKTDYLDKLYCREPQALFNIAEIMGFMHLHRSRYHDQNAMRSVIRYFEEKGGCH